MKFVIPEEMIRRLRKGDVVRRQEIIPLIDDWDDDPNQDLLIFKWAKKLEEELDRAGKPCTVRTANRHTAVRILTDAEAARYNAGKFFSGIRRTRNAHEKKLQVDTRNLDDEQKDQHTKEILVQAQVISSQESGLRSARKELRVRPCVRTVPLVGPVLA